MALRGLYSVSVGSNVDISNRLRAYTLSTTANAEEGSVAISQVVIDDPEGGINIVGLRGLTLTETAESSNQQVIYKGWTADRDLTRGPSMRTGAARLWNVNVADQNSLITRRIMRGSDANRPAETDVARVQWLMTTTEFGSVVGNSRYVSTLFPVAMDAVDYRDQSNQEILDDCAQASGKNYFVIWDEGLATPAFGLVYDFSGSSAYRSPLRLTNILGYVDNNICFGVSETETKLNRDPSRVYSGVILPFVGGEVYVQSSAVGNAFVYRDTTAPSVNVKTTAKATARANRYIADAATETDLISTSIVVPLSHVNHLKEGMAVQGRFAHMPGYDTGWTWMRVLRRTVTATSEEFYTIAVELGAAVGGLDAGGGRTSDGVPYPAPPIVDPSPLQSCVAGDGLTYFYTVGGTRQGLVPHGAVPDDGNWHVTSTDFLHITQLGYPASQFPLAGQDGNMGNGGVNNCVYYSSGTTYGLGGLAVAAYLTVIGPGTLTVTTTPGVGSCNNDQDVTLELYNSGSAMVEASDTKAVGTALSLTVNDAHCDHHFTVTSAGQFGLVSATWG